MGYKDLYFGKADARTEASRTPDVFLRSYIDLDGATQSVRDFDRFLVLGPKGTGKSALSNYVRLTGREHDLVVHSRDVSEFPLGDIAKLKMGDDPGLGRTLSAWRFLLLCGLVDVVLEDQGSELNNNVEALSVIKKLREYGFLDPTPNRAILHASRNTVKVPIPKVGEVFAQERTESLHLTHLVPYLEKWVTSERQDRNSYLLILDGLDSIYLNEPTYLPSISALIHASYTLNEAFALAGARVGVVVLIRNDIYARLSLPDGGKMRTDSAIELDWRMLSGNPSAAPLFELVNRKAVSVSGDPEHDVVATYFPTRVQMGEELTNVGKDIYDYLLNLTRHTPRDLLQLLENIRKRAAVAQEGDEGKKISPGVLREGVLQYATKYFVVEIRNELVGRGTDASQAQRAIDALREMRSRYFTREKYAAALLGHEASNQKDMQSADEQLRWLFYAGAIGNVVAGGGVRYLQFFHRRDDSDIYLAGQLVIHNALVYAWALPWRSPTAKTRARRRTYRGPGQIAD